MNVRLITNEENRGDRTFATERNGNPNLRGKTVREGVAVFSPEEFLASKSFDVAAEAARFLDTIADTARAGIQLPFPELASPAVVATALDRLLLIYKYVLFVQ